MKKIFLLFALLACILGMMAADKVELTRLAYDDGTLIRSTFLTSDETPFATVKAGTKKNPTFTLLSPEMTPVYSFTINAAEISGNDDSYASTLYFVNEGTADITEILVSQHLFNDDDLYEVVMSVLDRSEDHYYLRVYNENGEMLGILPDNMLYTFMGKYYIYSKNEDENEYDEEVSALYEIKKGGSAVAQVKAEAQALSVAPNPVGYEETATLSLPSDMLQGGVVKVFDLNGTLLFSKECKAGDTEILIPAYRLNAGVNPVVVADGEGNILGSGKIIRK